MIGKQQSERKGLQDVCETSYVLEFGGSAEGGRVEEANIMWMCL